MDFRNCRLGINNKEIMAQNASFSVNNQINPVYSIGYASKIGHAHSGPMTASLNFSYFMEISNEPNYEIITGLKIFQELPPVAIINFGETILTGYLNSYSFQIAPGQLIAPSVNYSIFQKVTGELINQPTGNIVNYNLNSGQDLAHYWTSKVIGNNITGEIIELGYSFGATWEPNYAIGSDVPYEVNYIKSSETIDFLSEYNILPTISGQTLQDFAGELSELRLYPISGLWTGATNYMNFPISGHVITQISRDISENILVTRTSCVNHF